ncbi:hypothetical protein [Streptomyces sp. NBC_01615]|uniref:hypothetical protein n=1 Tax=Streptomyces sp. NBC_01615 TaxID=2975898 RepID=UPI00386B804C
MVRTTTVLTSSGVSRTAGPWGDTLANLTPTDSSGAISIYNDSSGTTDLVVDSSGYYT